MPTPQWAGPYHQNLDKLHPDYNFPDGTITIEVSDGTLFKVHKHFFKDSGNSGTAMQAFLSFGPFPWLLNDVTRFEMEQLCSIFYPIDYMCCDPNTVEELSALLSISTKLQMLKIRALALKQLDDLCLPAATRLALAQQYKITRWIRPALIELCMRPEHLSQEEVGSVGLDMSIKLDRVRAEMLAKLEKLMLSEERKID